MDANLNFPPFLPDCTLPSQLFDQLSSPETFRSTSSSENTSFNSNFHRQPSRHLDDIVTYVFIHIETH